jgi:hypothetical protein
VHPVAIERLLQSLKLMTPVGSKLPAGLTLPAGSHTTLTVRPTSPDDLVFAAVLYWNGLAGQLTSFELRGWLCVIPK